MFCYLAELKWLQERINMEDQILELLEKYTVYLLTRLSIRKYFWKSQIENN